VDLRDGNQALIDPMGPARKRRMFELLVRYRPGAVRSCAWLRFVCRGALQMAAGYVAVLVVNGPPCSAGWT
jgi:hypothetical protein